MQTLFVYKCWYFLCVTAVDVDDCVEATTHNQPGGVRVVGSQSSRVLPGRLLAQAVSMP